ncbi:MAG: hypothetical protein L6V89_10895 [Oscillospiraceae bacterium]|nr:MAG: hypothetical protein L6V89_10895 [Oscillospiraceae bacterium]
MRKVKLIVHETYQGKRKREDVFAAVFLSNAAALTPNTHSDIIKDTERSQDSLCSEKGATEKATFSELINQSKGMEKDELVVYYRLAILAESILIQYRQ